MRARVRLLRHLGPAGLPLTAALAAALTVQALSTAAIAATVGLVVRSVKLAQPASPGGRIIIPFAILGGAILLGQVIGAVIRPLRFLAQSRIDGAHRVAVACLAASSESLAVAEDERVQDLIRTTRADPENWTERTPGDGALAQLELLIRYLGMAASAAVVAAWAVWLVPVLIIPALGIRALSRRQWLGVFRLWARGVPAGRRSGYWSEVAASASEGMELRVFGFGEWVIAQSQRYMLEHMRPTWAGKRRILGRQWLPLLLATGTLAVAFFAVASGTAGGHGSVAVETAVLTAGWGVFSAVIGPADAFAVEGALPVVAAREELERRLCGPAPEPAAPQVASGGNGTSVHGPPLKASPRDGAAGAVAAAAPRVRLEDVRFGYPGSDRPVLDHLNLDIRPGELLAIVGENGIGKSTLAKLLGGLYRPDAGRITADGADIWDPAGGGIQAWRRQIAIIFQDFVKYHLSAADNVALGKGTALNAASRQATLSAAASLSGLDKLVAGLPSGWDTPLSRTRPGGVDLSGGQWQHIALGRALYAIRAGARLLVMDEPTAHLDVRSEVELFGRLAGLASGISVVLISHRLSTVRHADRILLIAGGAVSESGSHDELMSRGGRYAELFTIQASRFARGYQDRLDEVE